MTGWGPCEVCGEDYYDNCPCYECDKILCRNHRDHDGDMGSNPILKCADKCVD